jgi:hypothetical protein
MPMAYAETVKEPGEFFSCLKRASRPHLGGFIVLTFTLILAVSIPAPANAQARGGVASSPPYQSDLVVGETSHEIDCGLVQIELLEGADLVDPRVLYSFGSAHEFGKCGLERSIRWAARYYTFADRRGNTEAHIALQRLSACSLQPSLMQRTLCGGN